MVKQAGPAAVMPADRHELTLRQLQEEAIKPLFAATGILGLALFVLNAEFPLIWRQGLLGLALMLTALLAYLLVSRNYLAAAWALLGGWLLEGLAALSTYASLAVSRSMISQALAI